MMNMQYMLAKKITRIFFNKRSSKAQSAMEYLMTYGWAILIIAVILGAFFSIGVFNPSLFVSSTCVLSSGLECTNYLLSANGMLTVSIENSMQDPINITGIGCSENKTTTGMTALSPQAYIPLGRTYTFNITCAGASNSIIGSLYEGYLQVNYTDDVTDFPQTIFGRLALKPT
ncbi:MAG: hypothetical protein ACP5RF_00615 [Candidatus Micrarchaeia archaeon]